MIGGVLLGLEEGHRLWCQEGKKECSCGLHGHIRAFVCILHAGPKESMRESAASAKRASL